MLTNMDRILALDPDTKLFCSDESTLDNFKWCGEVEGATNPHIKYCSDIFR